MYDLIAPLITSMWIHYGVHRRRYRYLHLYSLMMCLPDTDYGLWLGLYCLTKCLLKNRNRLYVSINRGIRYLKHKQGIWPISVFQNPSHSPV